MTDEAAKNEKQVKVEYLTRVEGEGGLHIRIDNGEVRELKLSIFEPPRFFEGFLRGRSYQEVPDITARICGICPVAYQMSAVHALEAALGVKPGPEIRLLRRLLYCAEWMESHALHIYLLHAPDFLGYESAVSLAADYPQEVERGLRLKKIGNAVLELLGGRATHPVSVCVGGFYKAPRKKDLLKLRPDLEWGLEASKATLRLVSGFNFPEFNPSYEFVSVSHPTEYPMNEYRIVSSGGIDIDPTDFERVFLEEHVARSTALHSVRADTGTSYFVGPLARVNLNFEKLLPQAKEAARTCGVTWPCTNPFKGIIARSVELIQAFEEALFLVDAYEEPERSRAEFKVHAGEGCAATEAPRGVLYHRYRLNDQGLVEFAKIVPPTSQNLRRMEDDLRLLVPEVWQRSEAEITHVCENLVRSYDPCISCSTHFLKLSIDRR
ncbi:MAG TPA: Ni/Fe hydrogenase subunit alpha [Terriglobia bacterium]|jgi:coenzyme F420-reducing hydrogenase alpha subunit|nr:Ni/Fe hydrogenase subunit alpha [Terriglobia bacterium]